MSQIIKIPQKVVFARKVLHLAAPFQWVKDPQNSSPCSIQSKSRISYAKKRWSSYASKYCMRAFESYCQFGLLFPQKCYFLFPLFFRALRSAQGILKNLFYFQISLFQFWGRCPDYLEKCLLNRNETWNFVFAEKMIKNEN